MSGADHLLISLLLTGSPSNNDYALCDIPNMSMKNTRYTIESLYENLFTNINTFVDIAIKYPSGEVLIVPARLNNIQYLHLG